VGAPSKTHAEQQFDDIDDSAVVLHDGGPKMTTTRAPSLASTQRLLGSSPVMEALQHDIQSATRSDAKVLLTGETGVGKEVVAHTIHRSSSRQSAPFVTINCAGVPDTLLESEFFGHARGSFTGADRDSPGLLRRGNRGTVFLDEIGEMSTRMQSLLLRFLETGEIQRVGGGVESVDVRVVAATNRDLSAAVSAGDFRVDLYYRINVLHIEIPPLRERGADIQALLAHYLDMFAEHYGRNTPTLSQDALDRLTRYAWPGNIRELKNVAERLVLGADAGIVEPRHLPFEIAASEMAPPPAAPVISHAVRVHALLERVLTYQESFWTVVYPAFMARDITRDDLRYIVGAGLERTLGNCDQLLELFNVDIDDGERFLGFLKRHQCHTPLEGVRTDDSDRQRNLTQPRPTRRRRYHQTESERSGSDDSRGSMA
jgi:transcriptional regulator with PAS, ATPase and Fis domain